MLKNHLKRDFKGFISTFGKGEFLFYKHANPYLVQIWRSRHVCSNWNFQCPFSIRWKFWHFIFSFFGMIFYLWKTESLLYASLVLFFVLFSSLFPGPEICSHTKEVYKICATLLHFKFYITLIGQIMSKRPFCVYLIQTKNTHYRFLKKKIDN